MMTDGRLSQIEARCSGEIPGPALVWRDRCRELITEVRLLRDALEMCRETESDF